MSYDPQAAHLCAAIGGFVTTRDGERTDGALKAREDLEAERTEGDEDLGPHTIVDQSPPAFLMPDGQFAEALRAPIGDHETTGTGAMARGVWDEPTAMEQGARPDVRSGSIPTASDVDRPSSVPAEPSLDVAGGETLVDFRLPLGGAVPTGSVTQGDTASEDVTAMQPVPPKWHIDPMLGGPQDETAVITVGGPMRAPSVRSALIDPAENSKTVDMMAPKFDSEGPTPEAEEPMVTIDAAALDDRDDVIRFGSYVLFGQVGVGGMAEVRLACQTGAHGFVKPCVIKRIVPSMANEVEFREMLREEARINRHLNHPNIVRLYDYDEVDGVPYLAMELVDGVNLSSLDLMAGDDGLPLPVITQIARDVANALAYAHRQTDDAGVSLNIIHRDVSPQNVLISRSGEVKLADFGIARFVGRAHHTAIGPPKGKLRYMAPEQLRYKPFDYRVDIFALGLVIIEMLSGRAVLPGGALVVDDLEALVRERLAGAQTRLPAGLVELLVRMTRPTPEDRPSRFSEIANALEAVHDSLSDRIDLGDYAAGLIAPNLPSAEDAIFRMLSPVLDVSTAGASQRPDSVTAPPVQRIDVSKTIEPLEVGFPTTSHFILAAEVGVSTSDAERLVSAVDLSGGVTLPPQEEDVPDTHLRLPAFTEDDELTPLGPRGDSAFGPTFIRPVEEGETEPPADAMGKPIPAWAAPQPKAPVHEKTTAADGQRPVVLQAAAAQRSGPKPLLIVALLVAALALGIGFAFVLRPLLAYLGLVGR